MRGFLQDVRYGWRMLGRSRGFTVVAILTIALGVGANTAIFSLLDGLTLRDLPVPNPKQLVRFGAHDPDDPVAALSLPMFQDIAENQTVFSGLFAWWGGGIFNVEANGELTRAGVQAVGGNFYSEIGVTPAIGRLIESGDVNLEAGVPLRVAVLGYRFWQRYYHGAKNVIGKTISIEDLPFTVIGVTRDGFNGMSADTEVDVSVPLTAEPLIVGDHDVEKHLQRSDVLWLFAEGRLKNGLTLNQARAELQTLWTRIRRPVTPRSQTATEPSEFPSMQMQVESGAKANSFLSGQFLAPIYLLLGISGLILLIACVNLASLMLSRAIARNHEFGVRVALGASRSRLTRQVLTETVMLAAAGTLAGLGFAYWGSHALAEFILSQAYVVNFPVLSIAPDDRILTFTAIIALLTGVLFGLPSAWSATRDDPNRALQETSRIAGRGSDRLGKALIITQVALSLVLLAGAGLFVRSLVKLREVQPGFESRDLLDAELYPKPKGYANLDSTSYYRELTSQISNLPGVESVGITHFGLGEGFEITEKLHVQGMNAGTRRTDFAAVMPGFFKTAGIDLIRGRTFTWGDDGHSSNVAIISENLAEELFSNRRAIGQYLDFATDSQWHNVQIVGIAGNASLYDIRKHGTLTLYVPAEQYGDLMGNSEMLIRTKLGSAAIAKEVRHTVESLGHEYVPWFWTVEQDINRSLWRERIAALLSAFFGGLALLLAAIGLFGLMSYTIARRTREIGIRMALGAQRSDVVRMVLRETFTLSFIGVLIGVPAALAGTRLIGHGLFEISWHDPVSLTVASVALMIVGLVAGYIPARRAAHVHPMVALRYE